MNAQIINIEDRRPEVNPQKENGYTAIANEIMDEICKVDIPSTQIRVLLAVLRKTYGWNKKGDYISVSQLSKICVCSKRSVLYALHNLEAKNIIKIIKNTGTSGEKLTSYIEFNKHHNEWVVQSLAPDYKQVIENTNKNKNNAKKKGGAKVCTSGAILGKKVVQRFAHTKDNNKSKSIKSKIPAKKPTKKEKTFSDKISDFVRSFNSFISKEHPRQVPNIKPEEWFQNSADTIDKLIRIDGFDLDYIKSAIRWAVKDNFWSTTVYSLAGLRVRAKNGLLKFQNLAAKYDSNTKEEQPKQKIYIQVEGVEEGSEI